MRRLLLLATVLLTSLAVVGCGLSPEAAEEAEGEGQYLTVGPLTYQIQLSRYLNPFDVEDKSYLEGLPPGTPPVGRDSIWFGVWMRVKNYSGSTATPTDDFLITDTQGNKFKPTRQSPTNPFTYQPRPLLHAAVYPSGSSAAGAGPIQGSLILFRLKISSLPNRPLVLHIRKAGYPEVTEQLDL